MWETRNDLLSFGDGNTAGNLETKPKAARGCGIRRPPNYVTRSPGVCNNNFCNTEILMLHFVAAEFLNVCSIGL